MALRARDSAVLLVAKAPPDLPPVGFGQAARAPPPHPRAAVLLADDCGKQKGRPARAAQCRQTGYTPIYSAIRVEILITPAVNLRGLILALDLLDNDPVLPFGRNIEFLSRYLYGFLFVGSLNRAETFGAIHPT